MTAVHEDLREITDSNMHDCDKVKGAAAIDAFPGLGKTTTALTFARQFHRREAGQHGGLTPDGNEHLPVCRVSLTAGTTIKALNQAILAFYAHPATGRYGKSTTGQLAIPGPGLHPVLPHPPGRGRRRAFPGHAAP